MKALPKDQQYPVVLRSGPRPHSETQRRNGGAMWLLLMICGIVLTMWALDEIVERVWDQARPTSKPLGDLSPLPSAQSNMWSPDHHVAHRVTQSR
jgi:hypothetical protein